MKRELRREMLEKRMGIHPRDIQAGSARICQTLLSLDCIKNAGCVMAYYAHKNEPDLLAFMHALLDLGKKVALPYIESNDNLIAVDYSRDSVMKSNVFGIPEPVISSGSEPAAPDVVLVPGVAFDAAGNRIGYGRGYFDRFLKETDALKIGVCFDGQLVAHIEAQPHDVRMDIIVTPSRVTGPGLCA